MARSPPRHSVEAGQRDVSQTENTAVDSPASTQKNVAARFSKSRFISGAVVADGMASSWRLALADLTIVMVGHRRAARTWV